MTDRWLERLEPYEDNLFPKLQRDVLQRNPWVRPWREFVVPTTGFKGPGGKGYARPGFLVICPSRCTKPGRGYSWPGHVSDCTEQGVYLHEVGHIVCYALEEDMSDVVRALRSCGDAPVTGYEPNAYETFAETFRLYFGNPDLLRTGRPRRYAVMREAGIRHRRTVSAWRDVLGPDIPKRLLDQCERWIERKR